MRPLTGIAAAALAGLAVAGKDPAEVYLFRPTSQLESSSNASPRIPREIARHIFLQRTSRDRYGSPLDDIPSSVDEDTAITYVNTFGRSRPSIFGSSEKDVEPAQLVVILEGMTTENAAPLRRALSETGQQPGFHVSDPPSTRANDGLISDLRAEGAISSKTCTVEAAVNPNDKSCWDGLSAVVRYDAKKSPEIISSLIGNLDRLYKFATSGELEALLVLLPESSRASKLTSWSSSRRPSSPSTDLRRRDDGELVISDEAPPAPAATPANPSAPPVSFWADNQAKAAAASRIPACFQSKNSCETRTDNCSGGHGVCVDRYANDTRANKKPCFACHCMRTVVLDGTEPKAIGEKTTRWAGNMCQKKDVSVPFWLLAGFTVGLVGVTTLAIGMLYSVGEEKLPGVIGAGVSRGSK